MADLANEGRGGAVWSQLAARNGRRRSGATGPRGVSTPGAGHVSAPGRAAQRALQPAPIASPQAELTPAPSVPAAPTYTVQPDGPGDGGDRDP